MRTSLLVLGMVLLLGGCATAYQAEGVTGGFSETQMAPDMFRVKFKGNGYTSRDRAQDLVLLRAAELTLMAGYSHFAVLNESSDTSSAAFTTPSQSHTTGTFNSTGTTNRQQGNFQAQTTTTPGSTFIISRPNEGVFIKCLRQEVPGALVFDAAFLQSSLRGKYGLQ